MSFAKGIRAALAAGWTPICGATIDPPSKCACALGLAFVGDGSDAVDGLSEGGEGDAEHQIMAWADWALRAPGVYSTRYSCWARTGIVDGFDDVDRIDPDLMRPEQHARYLRGRRYGARLRRILKPTKWVEPDQ